MAFLDKLFGGGSTSTPQRQRMISIDGSLGNVLMSGNSRSGKNAIIRNYVIDIYNRGGGCIIIRSTHDGFSAVPDVFQNMSYIHGIDTGDGAFTDQFNPFGNLNDNQMTDLLLNIFNKYSEFEPGSKMKFKQYISKMLRLIKASGGKFALNDLSQYTIEVLEDMNFRSRLPDAEKMQNERFFDSIRGDINTLESYFYDFANNNIGFILSGNSTLDQIMGSGRIIEVTLDFSTRKEESEVLLSVLKDKICELDARRTGRELVVVIDGISNDSLLKAECQNLMSTSENCHMVYSIMDIAMLSEKTNIFVDKADSLFFFQQLSNKNQDYCSELFGTYEKQKTSVTNTQGTNRTWNYGGGGYSGGGGRNDGRSVTITTEKERNYLPDDFKNLPDNQCIYFFKSSKEDGRLNLN